MSTTIVERAARPRDPAATRSGTVQTVQFLRFVAAGMVLIAHASFYVSTRTDPDFPVMSQFAGGVFLFFVISGFIMTVTSNRTVGSEGSVRYFVLSRLIRIVPLYWAVNAAKLLGLLVVPGMIAANPTASNVVLSLLFLPARNADGIVEAFYGVGWSLNFEMAFYALFALALMLRVRPAYLAIPVLLAGAALSLASDDSWPAFHFLLSPILLNFIWGILIGEWYLAGRQLPPLVATSLIVLGTTTLFLPFGALEPAKHLMLHFGAIVLGFVALEPILGQRLPRLLTFFGDASYSLYLTHPMFAVFAV
ncbi:MAG: acyltransferase, partial [Maritimibacter sp.]|nr:acyltransferase [Maritimibacter sp.]